MKCHNSLLPDDFHSHWCFHEKSLQGMATSQKLYCKHCNKVFFWTQSVENHEKTCRTVRGSQNTFCRCCKTDFASLQELDKHCFDRCTFKVTPPYTCTSCSVKNETADELRNHLKTRHLSNLVLPMLPKNKTGRNARSKMVSEIPCRFCGKTFKNKNWTISHERKEHPTESIKCSICSEQVRMDTVKSHQLSHKMHEKYKNTPKKVCNVCGIKIKNLDSHMKRHEDHRRHQCYQCSKTFKVHWDLTRHMLVHTNETKHICQICGKGFKVGYNLSVHMRIHQVVKPYSCVVCKRTFTTKQWRDRHTKSHHAF